MADERGHRIWALMILAGMALLACGWLLPYAVQQVSSGHRIDRVYLAINLRFPFVAPALYALSKLGLLGLCSVWVLRRPATPLLGGLILGVALHEAGALFGIGPQFWRSEFGRAGAGAFVWSAGIVVLMAASIGLLLRTDRLQPRSGGVVRVVALVLLAAEAFFLVLDVTAGVAPLSGRDPLDLFMALLRFGPDGSAFWVLGGFVLSAAILIPFVLTPGSGKFGTYLQGAALGLAVVTAAAAVARALIWGVILYPPPDRVVVAHTVMLLAAVVLATAILRTTKAAPSTSG